MMLLGGTMKHKTSRGALVLVCSPLLLSGCGGGDKAAADPSSSSRSPSEPTSESSTAAESPIDGTWVLTQSKADVVRNLEAAGFEKLADRFIRIDGVWAKDHWEWEFEDGSFTATWMQPDGAWKVADYGAYETDGNQVALTFSESGATSTFVWSVQGDDLTLDWQAVDSDPMLKGIPDEAFWGAYLTEPLTRAS
jgi:hypothetical protein